MTNVEDEGAAAAGILSWAYVAIFAFLTGVGRAFYSSQEVQPSALFELLYRWAFVNFVWFWIACQGRRHRAALPLDAGLFVVMLGPFAAPFLLWRRQRWRSLLKTVILVLIFAAAALLSNVLHYAIVALQSPGP